MNWFISDLHLNHKNIIEYCSRPFKNVKEMNDEIVLRWNNLVSENDVVYVVGDVFMGSIDDAKHIVDMLNGKKILILGNHDKSKKKMLDLGFSEVYKRLEIVLEDGKKALLCHKPIPESLLEKYDLLIHGHRHGPPIVEGKSINVCVDLWDFTPISEHDICKIKLSKNIKSQISILETPETFEISSSLKKEDLSGFIDHLQWLEIALYHHSDKKT